MPADVSSGRSPPRDFASDEFGKPGGIDRTDRGDLGAAALGGGRLEGRGAHRDHFLGIGRLDRGERVAGVDVALEGVAIDHLDDVRKLGDVEQRRDARHHVLAHGGRGGEQCVVVAGHRLQQQRKIFGERLGVGVMLDMDHLGDAGDLRRRLGDAGAILAGHQHVNVTVEGGRGGHRVQHGRHQLVVVMLGENQNAHQITFASFFNLLTSSATSATLTPAWRLGGSSTDT